MEPRSQCMTSKMYENIGYLIWVYGYMNTIHMHKYGSKQSAYAHFYAER